MSVKAQKKSGASIVKGLALGNETEIILGSIADGVFTVDRKWRITSFNPAAERITGIAREEALGRPCREVFRADICERHCPLRRTLESGQPIVSQAVFVYSAEGERIPVSVSTALLKDASGRVMGGVETFRDLSVVEELRKELTDKHSFFDIISKNKEMQRLFGILGQVADSSSTILIVGESGTGKELFARAVHALSPRRDGPLVTVNCGAFPDTLLESELFGYKAGAFTDARRDKPGRIARAEGGTLFLDEIGDVSPALQVRLLRVLQDKTYEPLGSTRAERADVRVVAATNRDLEELVAEGTFRQDLYYRINVVKLVLPPLRKRKEDIPLLVDRFVRKYSRLCDKERPALAPEVVPFLMGHDFPGNVRELENIMEYATVVSKNGMIGIEHLPDHLFPLIKTPLGAARVPLTAKPSLAEIERDYLVEVLRAHNWKRAATARALGMHPSTLWRKIKRLRIVPD